MESVLLVSIIALIIVAVVLLGSIFRCVDKIRALEEENMILRRTNRRYHYQRSPQSPMIPFSLVSDNQPKTPKESNVVNSHSDSE